MSSSIRVVELLPTRCKTPDSAFALSFRPPFGYDRSDWGDPATPTSKPGWLAVGADTVAWRSRLVCARASVQSVPRSAGRALDWRAFSIGGAAKRGGDRVAGAL